MQRKLENAVRKKKKNEQLIFDVELVSFVFITTFCCSSTHKEERKKWKKKNKKCALFKLF